MNQKKKYLKPTLIKMKRMIQTFYWKKSLKIMVKKMWMARKKKMKRNIKELKYKIIL